MCFCISKSALIRVLGGQSINVVKAKNIKSRNKAAKTHFLYIVQKSPKEKIRLNPLHPSNLCAISVQENVKPSPKPIKLSKTPFLK